MRGGPIGVVFVVGGNVVSGENVFVQMSSFQIKLRDASTSQRAQDHVRVERERVRGARVLWRIGPRLGHVVGDVGDEAQHRAFAPLVHERHAFAACERLMVRGRHPERRRDAREGAV